mgnify:CR=1 FL=1
MRRSWVMLVCCVCGLVSILVFRPRSPWRAVLPPPNDPLHVGPFSLAQQSENGTNVYFVAFQDGRYFWTLSEPILTDNVRLNQIVSFIINPTNDVVSRTTLETLQPEPRGAMIADFNGDGIPDKRQIIGERGWQLLYQGAFVDSTVDGGMRFVVKEGRKVQVVFKDGRWIDAAGNVSAVRDRGE